MSEQNYVVFIQRADGSVQECQLETRRGHPCSLKLKGEGIVPKEFVERDLFEAMVSLRRDLESANIKLLCAGARKDVWPSGMGRDMGAGVKAYITEMGKQATQLVCIFDRIPAEMVASVKEQRQHNEQWIEFFRKRRRDQGSH